jgi:hypothetical protein
LDLEKPYRTLNPGLSFGISLNHCALAKEGVLHGLIQREYGGEAAIHPRKLTLPIGSILRLNKRLNFISQIQGLWAPNSLPKRPM